MDKIYKNIIPNDIIDTVIREIPLSAFAVNKNGTKSKGYKIHIASIPYSGAPVTLGRKVIQKLCGLKGLGSFIYN